MKGQILRNEMKRYSSAEEEVQVVRQDSAIPFYHHVSADMIQDHMLDKW